MEQEFTLADLFDLALTDDVDLDALASGEVWSRQAYAYEGLEVPALIPECWRRPFARRGVLAKDVSPEAACVRVSEAYWVGP